MDFSTSETPEMALLGLVVLAAIPLVLFALWAEYYRQYLKGARKSQPGFDPKIEKDRIRIAQIGVGLFETLLFIGSLDEAREFPGTCMAVFLGCIFLLSWIRAGLEVQLEPVQLSGKPPLPSDSAQIASAKAKIAFRALLFGLINGLSYVVTLVSFVKLFAWISQAAKFSPVFSASFIMVGCTMGILSGLVLSFALAPWQMRKSFPVQPVSEEDSAFMKALFKRVGLDHSSFWIMDDHQATAAIAGFSWGRGIFRPGLFISKKVMETLNAKEVQAIVAHEAAHFLAGHLRKRVLLSAALILSLTFIAVFGTLSTYTWFHLQGFQSSVGVFFGFATFLCAFFILQKQSRVHEFQADWIAVQKLGADFESWASGLRKMDALNGFPLLPGTISTHPRTEIRIQNVAKMIEVFGRSDQSEKQKAA